MAILLDKISGQVLSVSDQSLAIAGSGATFITSGGSFIINTDSGSISVNSEDTITFSGGTNITTQVTGNTIVISGTSSKGVSNGLSICNENIILGGSLTGDTIINSTFGLAIGNSVTATGSSSIAFGCNTRAYGVASHVEGFFSRAYGIASHAEGFFSRACSNSSHAEGCNTLAIGNYSHSEGSNTQAIANSSHSEGRFTIASGASSHSEGYNTRSIGYSSHAEGYNTRSIGYYSHAEGYYTNACGIASHAEGRFTRACGNYSHAEGNRSCSIGHDSHAEGFATRAEGLYSHSGGRGLLPNLPIIASGIGSFNHSQNTSGQTINHGALANYSAILGGSNHNIESGNTGATIIGGYGIKLTGTTYANHVAVPQLAIITGLTSGSTGDTILVRDNTTGIIKEIPQSEVIANNGLTKIGDNIVLGGILTGDTIINTNNNGIAFGNNVTANGNNAFATGCQTCASGHTSHAEGRFTCAIGYSSHAEGYSSHAIGYSSHAEGFGTRACGNSSHAEGFFSCAIGYFSHAEGFSTRACGNSSHAEGFFSCAIGYSSHAGGQNTIACERASHAGGCGLTNRKIIAGGIASFNHSYNTIAQIINHGALATGSVILGGSNHNIESGNTRAAIIGGYNIKLTGTTYIDTTALSQLAIINGLTTGNVGDSFLIRNNNTGIIQTNSKPIITGSTGGNVALTNLLNQLDLLGLIMDNSI